jgi:exonuclease SbcC
MIPRRVRLEGVLCYKEAQEIRFDNGSLWMLSGLNGSGKSTVFDAVTYSLFGHHRGGSQDAHELINKDSDRAGIEFDFSLDDKRYRAYRTLQRTKQGKAKGTQQIFLLHDDDKKEPVKDTHLKKGFDDWVTEHIGLNYDTFTSSVLLLQGKAEKLLDSTAKGRFEVLAGIVDLEHYERLHRRADDQRKEVDRKLEVLRAKLDAVPEVEDAALAQAVERIATAEETRTQAEGEVERLRSLELQSQRWQELKGRLAVAEQRWQQAQQLLGDAAAIEKDVNRLRELREVLPRLQTILEQRARITGSEETGKKLLEQKEKQTQTLLKHDNALDQTRRKLANLKTLIDADEKKRGEVTAQFRAATDRLAKLREYEEQERMLAKLQADLARLPGGDPAEAVRRARDRCETLTALAGAVPLLARFQSLRDNLRQGQARQREAGTALQAVQSRGQQLAAEVEQLRPQVAEAERARQQADEQFTEARTLAQQAAQSLKDVTLLGSAQVCRHCGQKLTPGHLKEEKARRKWLATEAEERARQLDEARQTAQAREAELRAQLAGLEERRQEAREEFRACKLQMEQARQEVERLQGECRQTHAELAEPFRGRIAAAPPADWLATAYPDAGELADLRQTAAGLSEARDRLREAERIQLRWNTLKAQESPLRQALARLQADLPADREAVRQEHTSLESEEKALEQSLKVKRQESAEAQKQIDRLAGEREQTQKVLAEIEGKLNTEEATRQHCRQALAREQKELPAAWKAASDKLGLADLNRWLAEKDKLIAQHTDERGQGLQQARMGIEGLRLDWEDLQRQQDLFAEDARQEPAVIQGLLQQARQTLRGCDDDLVNARQQQAQLERAREQRQKLQQEYLEADKEYGEAKLLADLLGRDRLQLFLVRQAERQVVDHANAVLDRLSGGQLYLRLCGEADGDGSTAKALELEAYNRVTGEKPINVAFLSGSQKFRVAVSLALGIGQYASRQHRPIESVIIDEGFGCLDRQGRQVMIQELHNLREHLHCILLVSHQEEFAESFADGYHFELEGGATKVRPFRR